MLWPVRTWKRVRCWRCIYNRYHCILNNPFLILFLATQVEGGYLLNGTKMWITNSYESQAGVVFATSDKSQKHKVRTCILLNYQSKTILTRHKHFKMTVSFGNNNYQVISVESFLRAYHVLYFRWMQKASVWERRKINLA